MSKRQKILSILLAIVMVIPIAVFHLDAAAGTINESESNDVFIGADMTFDDYDNFGTISSSSDVDLWVINFRSYGMVNFWLGNIPSGSNLDLYICQNSGLTLIDYSAKTSNGQELIRCHVSPGTYIMKVVHNSGTTPASYKLRAKLYPHSGSHLFSFDPYYVPNTPGYVSPLADWTQSIINQYGFSAIDYPQEPASTILNSIKNSDVTIIYDDLNNATAGKFKCKSNTYLVGTNTATSSYSAIDSLPAKALTTTDLIIFAGKYTGLTNASYGSLVDSALNKGAFAAIGWDSNIIPGDALHWLYLFFSYCQSSTAYQALTTANSLIASLYTNTEEEIYDQYWGDSPLHNLVLDSDFDN